MRIRPAVEGDAPTVAEINWAARHSPENDLPPLVHDRASVEWWAAEIVLATNDVWLGSTDDDGRIDGFLALDRPDPSTDETAWLEHLYLRPSATGAGLGSALVEMAKRERPDGLQLWTFRMNTRARRFYVRHGFVEVEWTDGVDADGERTNEEGAPDVRLEWRP